MIEVPTATVAEISITDITDGICAIVDVREAYEWDAGHIPQAVHIPLNQLPKRCAEIDPDTRTFIICRTGGRSAKATAWLSSHGYNVTDVEGGMSSWLEHGYPIVSDSGTPTVL